MAPGTPILKKTASPRKAAPQTPKKTKFAIKSNSTRKAQPTTPGGASDSEIELEPEETPKAPTPRIRLYSKTELNPGQISSLYPWYYGRRKHPEDPRSEPSKSTPRKRKAATGREDEGHDSDNTFAEIEAALSDAAPSVKSDTSEEPANPLSHLPFGVKIEDLQSPLDRVYHEKRLEQAGAAAMLAKNFDHDQLMLFLNEIKASSLGDSLAGYIDWDRVNRVQTETRVADGSENRTREYYKEDVTDYPYNAYDGNEIVSAYAVMENIYFAVSNTRGDVKTYRSIPVSVKTELRWHRSLSHDIRAKHLIAATKEVEQEWKEAKPTRYRDIATLRRAFDYLSNMFPPAFPWACSQAFFEATLQMLRVNKEYCLCVFDEDTDRFMEGFRAAMVDAEKRRMKDWIEARTDEQFFDLMDTGMAPDFEDKIKCAPNPNSSAC
ncbi:uncharacterized protein PAC_18824 [Phialocephala subalpina]|uniref:Uncharacterized protein n=1 Tax=Phialocephala subalpina TaxID=576137 RepID=A0A1L7XV59_9HELO|nr:uncharacterized protein PAC_18824 [Phialocephala subalpina]